MNRSSLTVVLSLVVTLGWAAPALAQAKPDQPPEAAGAVKYEPVAPGVHAAHIFATESFRDMRIEVKDFVLGPGKSAPEHPSRGFEVTELKSGEVETTINGQTVRRRPGDFWVVRPGQKYAIKNLGGMVVLHAIIFTRK